MAAAVSRNVHNTDLLSLYEERLRRIVEECYEVAFILCNSEMEDFGLSKIFDIFNQSFSTAFILNTGYWPFFSSVRGQCLCICGRFGIFCRHIKSEYHWIDMQSIENDQDAIKFFPRIHGSVYPQDYDILIKPVVDEAYGYNISTTLNLQYKKAERGRPLRRDKVGKLNKEQITTKKDKDIYKQSFTFTIRARYNISAEFYPATFTIVFQPNPFFHDQYGTYFKKLCNLRTYEWAQSTNDHDKYYHVSVGQMPTSTLILQYVNTPVYAMPNQILVIYPQSQYFRQKCQKVKRNKGSQTPWKINLWNEAEDESDANSKLKELTGVWTYEDNAQILSDSIRNIASTRCHTNITNCNTGLVLMEDSEEYDNQLPNVNYNKAVRGSFFNVYSNFINETCENVSSQGYVQGFGQGVKRKCPTWATSSSDSDSTFNSSFLDNDIKTISEANFLTKTRKTQTTFQLDFVDGMPLPLDSRQLLPYILEDMSNVSLCLDSEVAFPYLSNEIPKITRSPLNYSEALKKPPAEYGEQISEKDVWLGKPFPSLRPKLNQREIDEEFDLIETVIQEDVLQRENNFHWWNATK